MQYLRYSCHHMCMLFQFSFHICAVGSIGNLYTFDDALVLFGSSWCSSGGNGCANQYIFQHHLDFVPTKSGVAQDLPCLSAGGKCCKFGMIVLKTRIVVEDERYLNCLYDFGASAPEVSIVYDAAQSHCRASMNRKLDWRDH